MFRGDCRHQIAAVRQSLHIRVRLRDGVVKRKRRVALDEQAHVRRARQLVAGRQLALQSLAVPRFLSFAEIRPAPAEATAEVRRAVGGWTGEVEPFELQQRSGDGAAA